MHDDVKTKISQLMDNELTQSEALALLQKMRIQPEMQDQLNRYEAISHALKTEVFLMPKPGFAERISQQIQQEPVYLLPQRQRSPNAYQKWAVAASIAAIALVLSWSKLTHNELEQNNAALMAQVSAPNPVIVNKQAFEKDQQNQLAQKQDNEAPLHTRINEYLQAHNNSVYTNGEANFKPFTRVTAYNGE